MDVGRGIAYSACDSHMKLPSGAETILRQEPWFFAMPASPLLDFLFSASLPEAAPTPVSVVFTGYQRYYTNSLLNNVE